MSKRWNEIRNDLYKISNEQNYEHVIAEIEAWAGYIENLENENKELKGRLDNYKCSCCRDTIVGVSHYQKYGGLFTFFERGGKWDDLDLSTYDRYQEFSMQLVYLLSEARKKFEEQSSEHRQQSQCFDTCESKKTP